MIRKKILLLISAILTSTLYVSAIGDSTNIDNLVPYSWAPISDIENILQYEDVDNMSKRTPQLLQKAKPFYEKGFEKMQNKEYSAAIGQFNIAMKEYKKARLSPDALNIIKANLALCYVHTGNKEDVVMAKQNLTQLTSKIYSDYNWMYNVAIAHARANNKKEAINLLAQIIRNDEFNFQSYITLEAIYKDAKNMKEANKVRDRLHSAEARFLRKKQSIARSGGEPEKKVKKVFTPEGVKPDIFNLNIVKENDHLQYENESRIKDRSMIQIQEGIAEYNSGVNALSNKNYTKAQSHLKNAEKKLKRGKIGNDGLSFTRGNLAIAYLCSGDKRSVGQAKRYLRYMTPKIYKTRDWTYNLAVAHYAFAAKQRSKNTKKEYMLKAVKYLRWTIKYDKLFLPAHENLIYVYKELEEEGKAQSAQTAYEKARKELMKSFSKQEQIEQGGDPYIFRVNLGTYEEFDTPAGLFDQDNLIIIPVSDTQTAYLAGLFYNLEEAITYQKQVKKSGYKKPFIVAFKDGEKVEF